MKPSNSAAFTWRTDLVVTGVVLALGAGGAVLLQKRSGGSMNPVVVAVMAFAVALAAALLFGACYIALVAAASGLFKVDLEKRESAVWRYLARFEEGRPWGLSQAASTARHSALSPV